MEEELRERRKQEAIRTLLFEEFGQELWIHAACRNTIEMGLHTGKSYDEIKDMIIEMLLKHNRQLLESLHTKIRMELPDIYIKDINMEKPE